MFAVNSRDHEAIKRVINFPKRGVGQGSVNKLLAYADANGLTLWEAMSHEVVGGKAGKGIAHFRMLITGFQNQITTMDAYDLVVEIYKKSGILAELRHDSSIEGIARMENVQSLLDGIKEFVENDEFLEGENPEDKSLSSFLQSIALLTDQDTESEDKYHVTMMSVHAAKGLEFDAVLVTGLEENLFPSYMSMSDPNQIDEERRLFYVAITRARQYLSLSYAKTRYQFGQMRFNDLSRFITEIDERRFDKDLHTGSKVLDSGMARIKYRFNPKKKAVNFVQYEDFEPSPVSEIQAGRMVLHQKFGKGEVLQVEGSSDNRVATISFTGLEDMQEKKILLKFAKLQVVVEE